MKTRVSQGIIFASLCLMNSAATAQDRPTGTGQIVGKTGTVEKTGPKGKKANRAIKPSTTDALAKPTQTLENVRIAAGSDHTCVVRAGRVVCWGNNAKGQLGVPNTLPRSGPIAVPGLTNAISVAAGAAHSCALLADETVSCWGDNAHGQLGDASTVARAEPKTVAGLAQVTSVAAGRDQTCAVTRDGKVSCWGDNVSGQVDPGDKKPQRTSPKVVPGVTNAVTVRTYAANTCATLKDNSLVCWGGNTHQQRGGRAGEKPTSIAGLENVREVGIGYDYVCATDLSGEVACWGWNHQGQLGASLAKGMSPTPQRVLGSHKATGLAIGNSHACLRSDTGTVLCWGTNTHGQLGDESEVPKNAPVQVVGLTNAQGLALGRDHSCALLADDRVMCWGSNYALQLGVDGARPQSKPLPVPL